MKERGFPGARLLAAALLWPAAAIAQPSGFAPRVQGAAEALAQDAGEYAARHGTGVAEAMARLAAQEESVAETDRIRAAYRDRLAGISIEHRPDWRIVVLLTGDEPVADHSIQAGGIEVPIRFRTGAAASRERIVAAMNEQRSAIRQVLPRAMGMGLDQRSGELVVMVRAADAERHGAEALRRRLADLVRVPVRIRVLGGPQRDLAIGGGGRVTGTDPDTGRRQSCTTGFVVTDGERTGIVTAAHCPDSLDYHAADGTRLPLEFVGQWGARHQDVQVHLSDAPMRPLFYADSGRTVQRALRSWRNRESTRAGDTVCRRGETTGYSCSEVELTDYAPGGELCGGPCDPAWTTVAGPNCRAGDSGGPIFLGGTAFGIVKGGNYARDGACLFSFYMSTDYLPEGWRLAYE